MTPCALVGLVYIPCMNNYSHDTKVGKTMRLRASDRVADYTRPASVAHENNWAFVHRESGITGTVYQQKNPHAAGMEWYARTEEGHIAVVRSRVQAVHSAVADQQKAHRQYRESMESFRRIHGDR